MSLPQFEALGDQALLLRWGEAADPHVNRQVHVLAARARAAAPAWLTDCVPAYASLAIFFDSQIMTGDDPMTIARDWLLTLVDDLDAVAADNASRLVEIVVCYGGDCGPDLDAVAIRCGLSPEQVVQRHTQPEYTVAMLGFSPGFPYLLGLDPALATPRLATPRLRVASGSVGIGGAQTGIYPCDGPGGWQLLGRTPLTLFDARRDPPSTLLPGDRVRFVAIDLSRYRTLSERGS